MGESGLIDSYDIDNLTQCLMDDSKERKGCHKNNSKGEIDTKGKEEKFKTIKIGYQK